MKRSVAFLLALLGIIWCTSPAQAQSKATAGLDKLRTLVGEWQGKKPGGGSFRVSYQLIANGSALMETLMPANEPSMVTVYHADGDNLMMTHYCSIANQPRMRAKVPAGDVKKLEFSFVDATNLANANDAHMSSLVYTFQDQDHVMAEWTLSKDGQKMPMMFHLERKK